MLQPYRDVLARPGAFAFSSAGVLARLPMSMVGIAVVLAVSEIYGSYGLAGQITAVYVIVHSICAPLLARLVDRHGQARVMRPAIGVAAVGLVGLIVALLVEGSRWWSGGTRRYPAAASLPPAAWWCARSSSPGSARSSAPPTSRPSRSRRSRAPSPPQAWSWPCSRSGPCSPAWPTACGTG